MDLYLQVGYVGGIAIIGGLALGEMMFRTTHKYDHLFQRWPNIVENEIYLEKISENN